jgi:hypothetical protein
MKNKIPLILLLLAFLAGFSVQNVGLFIPDKFLNAPGQDSIIDGMTEWLSVSYFDHGFMRRGFIGTALNILPFDPYYSYIFLSIIAYIFLLFLFYHRVFSKNKPSKVNELAFYIFTFSSAGAMNYGWMFGRFEVFNYLIVLICLNLIYTQHILITSILLMIALLIHEASIFYVLPILLAYSLGYLTYKKVLLVFTPVFCLAFLLAAYGNSSVNALGADREFFEIKPFIYYELIVIFTYISSISALQYIHRSFYKYDLSLVTVAPYATLLLYFFGVDVYRWITIFFTMTLIAMFIEEPKQEINATHTKLNKKLLILSLSTLLMSPLGPLGVVHMYPAFTNLLTLLSRI